MGSLKKKTINASTKFKHSLKKKMRRKQKAESARSPLKMFMMSRIFKQLMSLDKPGHGRVATTF